MTIILFELFSGINPFPGRIEQIFEAKRIDTKPAVPSDFPAPLKDLILQGWSKDPKERPQLDTFKLALNKVMGDDLQQSTSERDQLVALQTSTFNLEVEKTEENKLNLRKMLGNDEKKSTSFAASKTKVQTFKNSKEAKDQQAAFQTSRFNLEVEKTEENKLTLSKMLGDDEKKSTSFGASQTKVEKFKNSKEAKDQQKAFPTSKSNVGNDKSEENKSALNKILVNEDNKSTSFAASKTKVETFMNGKEAKDQQAAFPTSKSNIGNYKTEENQLTLRKMLVNDEKKSTTFAASRTRLETFMNSKEAKDQQAAFPTSKSKVGNDKTEENKLTLNKTLVNDENKGTTFAASRTRLETFMNSKKANDQEKAFPTLKSKIGSEKTEENKFTLSKMLGDEDSKSASFVASKTKLEAFMKSKKANQQQRAFLTLKPNLGTETEEYNSADSLSGNKDISPQVTSKVSREPPKWIRNVKTSSSIRPQETEKEKEAEAKQISVDQTLPEKSNFLSQTAENVSFKVQNRISQFEDMFASNTLKKTNDRREKQTVVEELSKAQEIKQEALVSPAPTSPPTSSSPPSPSLTPPALTQVLQQQHQQQAPMKAQKAKQEHHNTVTCNDIESGILFISYFKIFSKYSQT